MPQTGPCAVRACASSCTRGLCTRGLCQAPQTLPSCLMLPTTSTSGLQCEPSIWDQAQWPKLAVVFPSARAFRHSTPSPTKDHRPRHRHRSLTSPRQVSKETPGRATRCKRSPWRLHTDVRKPQDATHALYPLEAYTRPHTHDSGAPTTHTLSYATCRHVLLAAGRAVLSVDGTAPHRSDNEQHRIKTDDSIINQLLAEHPKTHRDPPSGGPRSKHLRRRHGVNRVL